MIRTSIFRLLPAFVLAITLAACGGTEAAPSTQTSAVEETRQPTPTPKPETATRQPEAPAAENRAVIRPDGDQLAFEIKEFSVKAGQTFTLVFENTASSAAMSHNVVIVKSAADISRVGQAAMSAGAEKAYIPDDEAVIAGTPLAGPGETVEVTFTVPDTPGEYPFICTFGGHYVMMQGTMKVTA